MYSFRQYRLALQIFQSNRLRRDYQDLASIAQYEPVGEFFFDEIYGARDHSDRDEGARRMQHMIHLLPGVGLDQIERALELLELTVRLDDQLAQLMLEQHVGIDFDEAVYERLYREADNYDDRYLQLQLIHTSLYTIYNLSRSHMIGTALHRFGLIARIAGMGAIYEFLRKGYEAVQGVTDIDHFAETIYNRELERLNRIYERAAPATGH